jgi:hypothetical protein
MDDILHGRMPHPDPRSSVDCACAAGPPQVAAYAAMARVEAAGPLAGRLYAHFLGGSGSEMPIEVADMIARDSGVRAKITQAMRSGRTTGTMNLAQSNYAVEEFQFAYGEIDCVQWSVVPPVGRHWRTNGATRVEISMLDYYEFHPGRPGISQCAHAACVELVARGSAKNFWTRGAATVTLAALRS